MDLKVALVVKSGTPNIKPECKKIAISPWRLCIPLRLKVLTGGCRLAVKRPQEGSRELSHLRVVIK